MRPSTAAFLLLLSVLNLDAKAQEKPPLLAVLEFDAPGNTPEADLDALPILTDAFRRAVLQAVEGRYRVMTRETMSEMFPPGDERIRCFVGKCVAEMGRMLQAPYIMAGRLQRLEGTKVLTVEFYESVGGQLRGSEQILSDNLKGLLSQITDRGNALVRGWMGLDRAAKATPEAAAGATKPPDTLPSESARESTQSGSRPGHSRACPAGLVLQPGGTYRMGAATGPIRFENETPELPVTVRAFCLGSTEVTQRQWTRVMGFNPSRLKGDTNPVEQVTWDEAVTFTNRLSDEAKLPRAYATSEGRVTWMRSSSGFRLPTESEWESAARAGFDAGRPLSKVAWFDENSSDVPHAVGTKAADTQGVHDLLGNVLEWTWDVYAPRASQGLAETGAGYRVARGGAFGMDETFLRPGFRTAFAPESRRPYLGLRIACQGPSSGP
ncbi:MAG: hypothetical protein RL199_252 [Pseudomonadota bacterium]|jgi:formylglycine-generating enzyme required for sulfatase activity